MAYKERGNGQGSVTILKDSKGKKKYQVRVTVGSKFDAEKERVIYTSKSLGVFKTKAEAVLAEYNSSPYDLTTKITTVGELYDYWSVKYFEKIAPMCVRHNSEGEFTSIREEDIPVIEKNLVAIMPDNLTEYKEAE